jgi:SAM-dependent methyltransferase
MTIPDHLLDIWHRAEETRPLGWDLGALADRVVPEELPWSWHSAVRSLLPMATHLLDMGTGGGEVLLEFVDDLPEDTAATEGWPPNLPVAREALEPHGITVYDYDARAPGSSMPFAADTFDLVLNRHDSFDAEELVRVLDPGGIFLTEQVGGDDMKELRDWFGHDAPAHADWSLAVAMRELIEAGMRVERQHTFHGSYLVRDVEALVLFSRHVPWAFPGDFGVDAYLPQLEAMHERSERGDLRLTMSRFSLHAVSPR